VTRKSSVSCAFSCAARSQSTSQSGYTAGRPGVDQQHCYMALPLAELQASGASLEPSSEYIGSDWACRIECSACFETGTTRCAADLVACRADSDVMRACPRRSEFKLRLSAREAIMCIAPHNSVCSFSAAMSGWRAQSASNPRMVSISNHMSSKKQRHHRILRETGQQLKGQ
jgi:hypothetical protein